ncbi:MAG: hypothetical protein ACE365_05540 [Gammaproteobacteria bacterium]
MLNRCLESVSEYPPFSWFYDCLTRDSEGFQRMGVGEQNQRASGYGTHNNRGRYVSLSQTDREDDATLLPRAEDFTNEFLRQAKAQSEFNTKKWVVEGVSVILAAVSAIAFAGPAKSRFEDHQGIYGVGTVTTNFFLNLYLIRSVILKAAYSKLVTDFEFSLEHFEKILQSLLTENLLAITAATFAAVPYAIMQLTDPVDDDWSNNSAWWIQVLPYMIFQIPAAEQMIDIIGSAIKPLATEWSYYKPSDEAKKSIVESGYEKSINKTFNEVLALLEKHAGELASGPRLDEIKNNAITLEQAESFYAACQNIYLAHQNDASEEQYTWQNFIKNLSTVVLAFVIFSGFSGYFCDTAASAKPGIMFSSDELNTTVIYAVIGVTIFFSTLSGSATIKNINDMYESISNGTFWDSPLIKDNWSLRFTLGGLLAGGALSFFSTAGTLWLTENYVTTSDFFVQAFCWSTVVFNFLGYEEMVPAIVQWSTARKTSEPGKKAFAQQLLDNIKNLGGTLSTDEKAALLEKLTGTRPEKKIAHDPKDLKLARVDAGISLEENILDNYYTLAANLLLTGAMVYFMPDSIQSCCAVYGIYTAVTTAYNFNAYSRVTQKTANLWSSSDEENQILSNSKQNAPTQPHPSRGYSILPALMTVATHCGFNFLLNFVAEASEGNFDAPPTIVYGILAMVVSGVVSYGVQKMFESSQTPLGNGFFDNAETRNSDLRGSPASINRASINSTQSVDL